MLSPSYGITPSPSSTQTQDSKLKGVINVLPSIKSELIVHSEESYVVTSTSVVSILSSPAHANLLVLLSNEYHIFQADRLESSK